METLGKPHYELLTDFYYYNQGKINKIHSGQQFSWNGCAYSPINYDAELNQGFTLGEDLVEKGIIFKKMENKDLSRDFAILFGIKPEEVPSNSSGNKSNFNALAKEVFSKFWELGSEQNNKLSKAIKDTVEDGGFKNNVKETATTEGIKMSKTNKQFLKEQVEELKKYSEMEYLINPTLANDPLKYVDLKPSVLEDDKIKIEQQIVSDFLLNPSEKTSHKLNQTFKNLSELKKYYNMQSKSIFGQTNQDSKQLSKNINNQTDEKEPMQNNYIVKFKDGKTATITESMFENLNPHHSARNLLFATDSDTGEMICLDSSSILSIVKYN